MSPRARLVVLLVSAPIVAFAVIGGFLGKAAAREDAYQFLRVFEDVVSLVLNNYVEDVDVEKTMHGALRGLAEGLDPDSAYLRPEQVQQIETGAPMPEGETGLELTRQYYLRVIAARDGSPAARAGLLPGDYVRAINGQSTRDMSVFEGGRLLRGAVGSKVTLTVIRGNAAEPHAVDLVREKLGGPNVTARVVAPGIGYLRIAAFGAGVAAEITGRVQELARAGATRLVIDVRRTPQGIYEAGTAAARLFVPSGTLAVRESRDAPREPIVARTGDGSIRLPVVLLVNGGTGGAAEVFVAALAGNRRAEVIGERTAGRAALQRLVKLPDGSGLWLTSTRFLTPGGEPVHEKGLAPNIEVEEADIEFGAALPETDPVLQKALERLSEKPAA